MPSLAQVGRREVDGQGQKPQGADEGSVRRPLRVIDGGLLGAQLTVKLAGKLTTVGEVENVVVAIPAPGSVVRVKDVATVVDGIAVRPWPETGAGDDLTGDVLIEGFGCALPAPTLAQLAAPLKQTVDFCEMRWLPPLAVHRAGAIELFGFAPEFLDQVAAGLDRNNKWDLSVAGGTVYLATAGGQHETAVARIMVQAAPGR